GPGVGRGHAGDDGHAAIQRLLAWHQPSLPGRRNAAAVRFARAAAPPAPRQLLLIDVLLRRPPPDTPPVPRPVRPVLPWRGAAAGGGGAWGGGAWELGVAGRWNFDSGRWRRTAPGSALFRGSASRASVRTVNAG